MHSQFLGWDIRDGSGDRHGDEDSSADDSADIDGAGSLIEDAVEDWENEHHGHQSEDHVDI